MFLSNVSSKRILTVALFMLLSKTMLIVIYHALNYHCISHVTSYDSDAIFWEYEPISSSIQLSNKRVNGSPSYPAFSGHIVLYLPTDFILSSPIQLVSFIYGDSNTMRGKVQNCQGTMATELFREAEDAILRLVVVWGQDTPMENGLLIRWSEL